MKDYIKFILVLIIVAFVGLIIINASKADEIRIPYSCYPKELQSAFLERGYKLDLNGNDRTKDSFGFIENKGSNFIIYTYRPATEEDFNLIMELINGGAKT